MQITLPVLFKRGRCEHPRGLKPREIKSPVGFRIVQDQVADPEAVRVGVCQDPSTVRRKRRVSIRTKVVFTNHREIPIPVFKQNVTIPLFLDPRIRENMPIISPSYMRNHSSRWKDEGFLPVQVARNHSGTQIIEVLNPAMEEDKSVTGRCKLAVRQVMKRTVHGRVGLQSRDFLNRK